MTIIEPGKVVIQKEASQQCDDCGQNKELRPYGPNGSKVCFECAMKDPEGTENRYLNLLMKANVETIEVIE